MITFQMPEFSLPTSMMGSAPALQLQQKTVAMFMAIPQVMTTRIWNLASMPMDTDTQQKEIQTMISEKEKAFIESIGDINSQIIASQLALGKQWMNDWQRLISGNHNAFNNFGKHIDSETIKIMDKGISPYAKTVQANKMRLVN
ncbi:hypothetical protein ACTXGO_07060 [Psychrobacter sp. T6-1]|uniref:hypothetical protein n=1 Tax=Psychrobacter sp. T6-1 TaxID=3457447 RepID=UPI003FD46849